MPRILIVKMVVKFIDLLKDSAEEEAVVLQGLEQLRRLSVSQFIFRNGAMGVQVWIVLDWPWILFRPAGLARIVGQRCREERTGGDGRGTGVISLNSLFRMSGGRVGLGGAVRAVLSKLDDLMSNVNTV
jgi:hypothetical protein